MADRDITLWVNERWYAALQKQYPDGIQEKMEELLDGLINQLPEDVYSRIDREIHEEKEREAAEREAERRFSVFRTVERCEVHWYFLDEPFRFANVAYGIRDYLRNGSDDAWFHIHYAGTTDITPKEYQSYLMEFIERTGRVTGVFDIDLDKKEIATLSSDGSWMIYPAKAVSSAAYRAWRTDGMTVDTRTELLLEDLSGKAIAQTPLVLEGSRPLYEKDICFDEEIQQMDNLLNFYLACWFNVDEVFGTHVCSDQNDDYLNLYVNYDMDKGEISDTLEVTLCRGDGTDANMVYRLGPLEKAAIQPKMEEYCQRQAGLTLDQWRERYLSEQQTMPTEPVM